MRRQYRAAPRPQPKKFHGKLEPLGLDATRPRSAWLRGAHVLAAALALAVPAARARAASPGTKVVREIIVENAGPGRLDRSFVLAHASARTGVEFDSATVAEDVRALLDTGLFSAVDVYAEQLEDGVRLVYSLRNKLKLVSPISITGVEHFRHGRIRDWLGLKPGDLVDDQVLGARTRKIVREYQEDFYPKASVSWDVTETDRAQGLAEVSLSVREGGRSKVKKVLFSGNQGISSRTLSGVIKQRAWWNPVGWFVKRRYETDELEMARLDIRDHYLNQGFLDVAVDGPDVQKLKKGKVLVTFSIREGPAYRFGELSLDGVAEFPEASLGKYVLCRKHAPARADIVRATIRGVTDHYGARGYIETIVRPVLTPDKETGVVDVHFAVTEGKLARIRNIRIRGNSRTRDKVIRRELLVYPGDVYNTVRVNRSERRLMNLGFFSSVRAYDESALLPDERDLIFEVEEKRTGQLMMGVGFSSIDRLVGFAELSQGNFDLKGWPYFTGGGQKLRLRGQFGSRRKRYELSFTEPWFMDRRLSVGLDLYRSDVDFNDYDLKRTGGAIRIGTALPGPNRINFRYQLEKVELSNFADTNRYVFADSPDEEYFFEQERNATESSLKMTLTHDTRDNPFFPSRGNKVSAFGKVAGGIFGFDTDVYNLGFRSWHYLPLWYGHVLSLRTRYEVVEAYGDIEDVPISHRLFLGGGRTLRGFDYRDVGPKVIREATSAGVTTVSHRPYGGQSLALASLEYTVPLVARVRLAGFYDTGNAWRDLYELDLNDLASSAGVGIRLDMPGFPIRVDRAWVLEKDDELTDKDSWVVWIGYDY